MSGIFRLGGVLIVLASLLTGFNSVLADSKDPVGDWWLVYSVGTGKNNIVFVADLTSMTPPVKKGGTQFVEVSQIFADRSKPLVDVYTVEVQCAKHRARFVKGTSTDRASNVRRDLEVSNEWLTLDDNALLYTFGFVCNPRDRVFNGMLSLGKFTHKKLLETIAELQAPPKTPMQELEQMLGNDKPHGPGEMK